MRKKRGLFVYQRELAPGTRLEQYEIIRVLGSGGFGITYLAKDLFLNRNVVIKENFPSRYSYRDPLTGHIRPNNEHDLENYTWALKSFLSEAQTLAELNNPASSESFPSLKPTARPTSPWSILPAFPWIIWGKNFTAPGTGIRKTNSRGC